MSKLAFLRDELKLIRKYQKSGDIFYAVQCIEDLLNCHMDLAYTSEKPNIPLRLSLGYNQ